MINKATHRRPAARLTTETVNLSHGSGGKDMRDLIDCVFVAGFDTPELSVLEDQARLDLAAMSKFGGKIAFTTDSYVIDPIFFPGGNIGDLAVNGTINDIAVSGAVPLFISCAMIIEEGFPLEDLRRIVASMKAAADRAGVKIVTGDTKVVERKAADKIFINTTGIGSIPDNLDISIYHARPGDAVIVNGTIGDHGAAIMSARADLALEAEIQSDCQALAGLISEMTLACPSIRCLRDATRGGIASVLNEISQASHVCVRLNEEQIPISEPVRGICEILGLDPLYLANEGKIVCIAPHEEADRLVCLMRQHEHGRNSATIGKIDVAPEETVVLHTFMGGQRIVDMLIGEQLPRIC